MTTARADAVKLDADGSGHRRVRLLFVHHAHDLGGALRSLSMLISGLDKKKYDPIVAIPARPGSEDVRAMLEAAGARVLEEQHIRPFHGSTVVPCSTVKERLYSLAGLPLLAWHARKLVRRLKPDVVHLNSTCVVGAAFGARLSGQALPVVAHVREPLLMNWWGRLLAWMNRRFVDHFISIDEAGLISLGDDPVEGSVIYNFVDTNKFHPNSARRFAERAARGWGEGEVVFLSLARITPANGALELAQAVCMNESRMAERAKVVIAGFEYPYGSYQQQAFDIAHGSSRSETIPFTSDIVGLLDAADVVIAPFTTPHSARSIFEGAVMGKPGLVTRLPNLQELIREGETGLSYMLDDVDALIDAINHLCDDDCRQRFASAAREFGMLQFGAEANVEKTTAVYSRLLSGHEGAGAMPAVSI